jgi:hypothetical protein
VGQEVWLLLWYCVTIANPACMKWDGTTEMLVTSFKSEGECASYAKTIARKIHSSLHFDLEYLGRSLNQRRKNVIARDAIIDSGRCGSSQASSDR